MKFAVIDTETNGLPDYTKAADDPTQPRLAALGVIMVDFQGGGQRPGDATIVSVEAEHEFLVKPDGWSMTQDAAARGAAAINGLTDERLAAEGIDVAEVLGKYRTLVTSGYAVAAYGAQHDCKIIRGEFRRRGLDDLFDRTPNVCLMRACQSLKVPKASGKGGWPRLEDACRHFGVEVESFPHGALAGARAALGVFIALANLGALPEASVHYAAAKPTPKPAEAAPEPAAKPKRGDLKTENNVELEHDGLQWLPIVNAHNYPARFAK